MEHPANRDDATFDLGRSPNHHLAFGFGPHFCSGAFLGRAEIGAVLKTLTRLVDDIILHDRKRLLHAYSSLTVELN